MWEMDGGREGVEASLGNSSQPNTWNEDYMVSLYGGRYQKRRSRVCVMSRIGEIMYLSI